MDEIFKFQESLIDSLQREDAKFTTTDVAHGLDNEISRAKEYCGRLANLKRDILSLKDRAEKLATRSNKILDEKKRVDIEKQRSKEQREILERHLEPVVNTNRD